MAYRFGQIRYHGDSTNPPIRIVGDNYPSNLTKIQLQSGTAFKQYSPMVALGIQALPGTKFYINGNMDSIIVGQSGIYELNVKGLSYIYSLKFDAASLDRIATATNGSCLIVDFIYESGD